MSREATSSEEQRWVLETLDGTMTCVCAYTQAGGSELRLHVVSGAT